MCLRSGDLKEALSRDLRSATSSEQWVERLDPQSEPMLACSRETCGVEGQNKAHPFRSGFVTGVALQTERNSLLSLADELCCCGSRAGNTLMELLAAHSYSCRCSVDSSPQESIAGSP